MLIYIFLLLIIALPALFLYSNKTLGVRPIYIWLFIAVISFFSGIRDMIGGYDIYIYASYFDSINTLGNYHNYEYGYYFLSLVINTIGGDRYLFFFIVSLIITIGTFSLIARYSRFSYLAVLIVFSKFFLMSFVYLRQGVSIAIAWLAIKFALNRQFFRFSCTIFMATLFHKSALLFFIIYFLTDRTISNRNISVLFLMSLLLGLSPFISISSSFIGEVASSTKLMKYGTNSFNVNYLYILEAIFFVIPIFMINKNKIYTRKDILFFNICIIYICILLLTIKDGTAYRYSWVFLIGLSITVPKIISLLENKKIAYLYQAAFVLYLSLLYIRLVLLWDGGDFLPYKSIFEDFNRNGRWEFMEYEY